MCGIAGIIGAQAPADSGHNELIQRMLGAIAHRGPDDCSAIVGKDFALGSVRLSIVDIEGGLQPARSEDKKISIVFNGEIFNFMELRQQLIEKGYRFQSRSEIETLLNLYMEYGPDMVTRLNGQFAIAIHDKRQNRLYLFRDPFGIRPLFWMKRDQTLLFASEVKSLMYGLQEGLDLDRKGILQTLNFWTVAGERTSFRGVKQIPPGHFLIYERGQVKLERYWEWPIPCTLDPLNLRDDREYFAAFREQFDATVKRQSMADVKVASYLSGGIDSSVVALSLSRHLDEGNLSTFSVTFDDPGYDETEAQNVMVDHLGAHHVSQQVTRRDIAQWFPNVVEHAETPLFRTAPVPLFMLSRRVQENGIKVVMTGEGADEVLLGYDLFRETKIRRFWGRQPDSKFRGMLLQKLYHYLPQYRNKRYFSLILDFYRSTLTSDDDRHYSMLVRWANNAALGNYLSSDMQELAEIYDPVEELDQWLPSQYDQANDIEKGQVLEIMTLMSNYLLSSQGDRMTMAHSVESRYPYLDLDFVKFVARLPENLKLRSLRDKFILRESYAADIPKAITQRPKVAYQAPELTAFFEDGKPHDYVADTLSIGNLEQAGIFNPSAVRKLVEKGSIQAQMSRMGFRDNMAFVLALSTTLLGQKFGNPPTQTKMPIKIRIIEDDF
jgi:asparagine synthase (glutamine-hydrolysing)